MDYLYYILAVLIVGLLCIVFVLLFTRSSHKQQILLSPAEKRRAMPAAVMPGRKLPGKNHLNRKVQAQSSVLERELRPVPTPWGWPNHPAFNGDQTRQTGLTDVMISLTDHLVRQKKLAETQSTSPRTSGSIRALLEDRYGPVNKHTMGSIEYQPVKRPLLRDPSEPHDQMDNFGSGEAERIRAKFKRVVSMQSSPASAAGSNKLRYVEVKFVKQPWGW